MDLWLTRGRPEPQLPHVPGCDVAGTIDAVGEGVDLEVGAEVVVNPAVSTLEAVVHLGNDAPVGRGFQILGEQRWGGHRTEERRVGKEWVRQFRSRGSA